MLLFGPGFVVQRLAALRVHDDAQRCLAAGGLAHRAQQIRGGLIGAVHSIQ